MCLQHCVEFQSRIWWCTNGTSMIIFLMLKSAALYLQFAEFDLIMRTDDPKHLEQLIEKVSRWLICARWKKMIYGVIEAVKCMLLRFLSQEIVD